MTTHPEISQEAARAMLAALKELDAALCAGFDTREGRYAGRCALINARAAIAAATRGGQS